MNFGYADESGEPGVQKNSHDFFVFCIILLDDRDTADKVSAKIQKFREKQGLPENYEFHYANNSKKVRAAFIDFIKTLDFNFVSASTKKNNFRSYASNKNLAEATLRTLERQRLDVSLEMDKNPQLCKELRTQKKNFEIQFRCSEKESRGHDLIQLADYVTALRTRFLKYPDKGSAQEAYRKISRKLLDATIL